MKFGFRKPSLKKRLAARVSVKRMIRHRAGLKMPRGYGFLTNPKRALYNRVYNRTSFGFGFLTSRLRATKPVSFTRRPWMMGGGIVLLVFLILFTGLFGVTVALGLAGYYFWNRNR